MRGFSFEKSSGTGLTLVIPPTVLYSSGVSRLRRPFLCDRFLFVTVCLLRPRSELDDADLERLALAIRRAQAVHPFFLTAWVFLSDPAAAGHAICAPQYPLTISEVMKSIKNSSTKLTSRGRGPCGEPWQGRFLDRTLRTVVAPD